MKHCPPQNGTGLRFTVLVSGLTRVAPGQIGTRTGLAPSGGRRDGVLLPVPVSRSLGGGLSTWRGSSTRVLPPVPSPGAPSDSSPSRPQMGNSGKAGAHAANDAGLGDAAELGKQIRTHRPSMPAAPWRPPGCAGAPSTVAA